jgi:alanine racemase
MAGTHNSWLEISREAFHHNIKIFRALAGGSVKLMVVVKANAYGHGLLEIGGLAGEAGIDFLGVNALYEAMQLREEGIGLPVLILGYVSEKDVEAAVRQGFHITVYNRETVAAAMKSAEALGRPAALHLKVETGTFRQGVHIDEIEAYFQMTGGSAHVRIAGLSTHFANIEDTTDHSFAAHQLEKYNEALAVCRRLGLAVDYRHTACTAATLLFPKTYFDMVRVGIGAYGLWPSKMTFLSSVLEGKPGPDLRPVMTWKSKIAQLKHVPPGTYIGYGCTYRTTHETMLAVLPVGYYDGYDRRLSNVGYVLIRGKRAPVRGRVCMNLIMVDVTHIPEVALEDEAVLLGAGDHDRISSDDLAALCHTINYEIVSRISPDLPRMVV